MIIKYRTTNPVTHLDVTKMIEGGTTTGVVSLLIGSHNIVNKQKPDMSGYDSIVEVAYEYNDENGNVLPTNDGGVFRVLAGVKELSQSINSSLPSDDNIIDRLLNEVKVIAAKKLADRFGLEISDVEEVV